MKFRSLFALTVLVLGITACGSATPTPRPTATNPPPTIPPTAVPPTATPTLPPTATPTQTPVPVQSTAKQDVSARKGPGLEYPIAQKLTKGTAAVVLGKNSDGKWLQIAFPDATNPSWVSATFLTITGPLDTLQVVQVAPAATATRGAAVTTSKTTPTTAPQVFPAPRGGVGFVYYEDASTAFIAGSIAVDSHAVSGLLRLGSKPGTFDVNPDTRTNASPMAWSPDGSTFLFVYNQGNAGDVLKYAKQGTLDSPVTIVGYPCISSPNMLPDNKSVAFIGMGGSSGGNSCTTQKIYKMFIDGTTAASDRVFFTARPGESLRGLAWGPFVLFVSNLGGGQEIWRMNQDGTGPIPVTSDGKENGTPAWSPDGKLFAYYSKQTDGTYQIMTRNQDGSNPRKLTTTGHNFSPVFSPDGNWIAFTSDRGGRNDIYIMNKNGGQVQLLTDKSQVGGAFSGAWR
jgi:uncharacterized protein YraI